MGEAQEFQKRAQEIIERERQEQSKVLDLSSIRLGGKLEAIPDEVFDLHQLEGLFLRENNIREVPEKLRNLSNIKRLSLFGNPIERVPDVPGLGLDWAGYLRCRKGLSRENVEQIWIRIDEEGTLGIKQGREPHPRLLSELALLPRLHSLTVAPPSVGIDTRIAKPPSEIK